MNKYLALAFVFFLSACSTPNVTQGEKPEHSSAIVISKFIIFPANSPVLVKVSQNLVIGPDGMFKVENGNNLSVTTLMYGQYAWGDILNVRYNGPVNASSALPKFNIKPNCINYIGDVTLDFSGARPAIHMEKPSEVTLSEFKVKYPKMFEVNSVCPY